MSIVPLKIKGARQNVPNRELRRVFTEAAQLRGETVDVFAHHVGEALGWLEFDRLANPDVDAGTCAVGVLVLLGLRPDKHGRTREVMRAWRAYQVAYLLSLESTMDAAAAA